jgi:hypothetical protein
MSQKAKETIGRKLATMRKPSSACHEKFLSVERSLAQEPAGEVRISDYMENGAP